MLKTQKIYFFLFLLVLLVVPMLFVQAGTDDLLGSLIVKDGNNWRDCGEVDMNSYNIVDDPALICFGSNLALDCADSFLLKEEDGVQGIYEIYTDSSGECIIQLETGSYDGEDEVIQDTANKKVMCSVEESDGDYFNKALPDEEKALNADEIMFGAAISTLFDDMENCTVYESEDTSTTTTEPITPSQSAPQETTPVPELYVEEEIEDELIEEEVDMPIPELISEEDELEDILDGDNNETSVMSLETKNLTSNLGHRLKGQIVLQVEENGEAWYLSPVTTKAYFLGRPADAFDVMRNQGIGISNENLDKIPVGLTDMSGDDNDGDGLSNEFEDAIGTSKNNADTDGDGYSDATEVTGGYDPNMGGGAKMRVDSNLDSYKGKIFLQVENNGEAWYVNPTDGKRYFLGRPDDAFQVMRELGLGISNENFTNL